MAVWVNANLNTVSAQDDVDLLAAVVGDARMVFPIGKQFKHEIIDNNNIRIYDGVMVSKGRRIQISAGLYDNFYIPSGTQGGTQYYIIGYHLYTASDGKELCETFVRQMDNATDTIEEATFRTGETEAYISMYRVMVVGLTLTSVDALFDTMITLHEINRTYRNISSGTVLPDTGKDGDIFLLREG